MTEIILNLILAGATIFTDERRRKFESNLYELLNEVQEAKTKRFPDYSDAAIKKAEANLDNYLTAYAQELRASIAQKQVVAV